MFSQTDGGKRVESVLRQGLQAFLDPSVRRGPPPAAPSDDPRPHLDQDVQQRFGHSLSTTPTFSSKYCTPLLLGDVAFKSGPISPLALSPTVLAESEHLAASADVASEFENVGASTNIGSEKVGSEFERLAAIEQREESLSAPRHDADVLVSAQASEELEMTLEVRCVV